MNVVTIGVYERYLARRRGVLMRWKEEIMGRKFSSEFIALRVLNKTNEVSYANICAIAKLPYILEALVFFACYYSVLGRPRIIELSAFSTQLFAFHTYN
jgi:hypothetical protein